MSILETNLYAVDKIIYVKTCQNLSIPVSRPNIRRQNVLNIQTKPKKTCKNTYKTVIVKQTLYVQGYKGVQYLTGICDIKLLVAQLSTPK